MTDRRLFVPEPEFAKVLGVTKREGNTLSPTLRAAWDHGDLRTLTKASPLRADGAHITVLGHITRDELLRRLDDTEIANGLVNRFLIVSARRSQLLPEGGNLDDSELAALAGEIRPRLEAARKVGRIRRTPEAVERWAEIYAEIAESDGGGLVGAVTARAEAQTLRLQVLYALLAGERLIGVDHLEAAYAAWRYCDASARYVFGEATGDPVADRIRTALIDAGPLGLDGTDLRDLFQKHESGKRLQAAVGLLQGRGLVAVEQQETGGRPRNIYRSTECDQSDESDQRGNTRSGFGRLERLGRTPEKPPELDPVARHGTAGKVVDLIGPHTEADPAALLFDFLAAFGNAVGAGPHAFADAAEHPGRLFVLTVGETARARKGSARANVARLMRHVDPGWAKTRVVSGLSSGEGLIAAVSDTKEPS